MNTNKLMDALRAHCLRCHHSWLRREAEPKQCPACRSPFWNQPYQRAIAKENRAEVRGDKKAHTNWAKLEKEAAERRRANWRRASNAYHARKRAEQIEGDAKHQKSSGAVPADRAGSGRGRGRGKAGAGRKAQ